MQKLVLSLALAATTACLSESVAQETSEPSTGISETAELEAAFKATLTNASLKGRWCLIQDGALTPEREESYGIRNVARVSGDLWIITARIQYGTKDITAPIPVRVKWAGDTPVIMVTDVPVPGSGTYSARVMIYRDTYAGSWSGGDHGGLLNGLITREPKDSAGAEAASVP